MMIQTPSEGAILQGTTIFCPLRKSFKELRRADKKHPYRHGFGYEAAEIRVHEDGNGPISNVGFFTAENSIYFQSGERWLTRNPPILESEDTAKKAEEASRLDEFFITDKQIETALLDAVRLPPEGIEIPLDRLGEEELTVWFYGRGDSEKAQRYGYLLKGLKNENMTIWVPGPSYITSKTFPDDCRAFARQYRLGPVSTGSRMGGYQYGLTGNQTFFGARYIEPAQAVARPPKTFGERLAEIGENLLSALGGN
jgi:hypothetical protein